MKKTLIVLSAVLAFAACSKTEVANTTDANSPVTFNISVGNSDDTKAVKSAWANGDKIYVFFEGIEEKWLELTYDGSAWNAAPGADAFVAGDFSVATKELTAVHIPVAATVTYASSKFSFTDASGNPIYTYYLFEANKAYTVSGETVVNATISLAKPANFVWFHVAGIEANADQYYLKEAHLNATACDYVALAGGVTEKVTAGHVLTPVADADGAMYAAKGTALGSSADYKFQLVKVHDASDMFAKGTYTRTVTGKTLAAGKQVNLTTPLSGFDWTWNQWVDLGFASNNVLWATGNLGTVGAGVGITTPTSLGRFCSWGNTTPHMVSEGYLFDQNNASHYNALTGEYTRYNTTDGLTTLQSTDDAASACLGGAWRMPTAIEAQNLVDGYSGTADYESIAGYAIQGPSGVSLFIIANGYITETGTRDTNTGAFLLTSNLGSAVPKCTYLRLLRSGVVKAALRDTYRYRGMGIRPVKEEDI